MDIMLSEFIEAVEQPVETLFIAIIENPNARRWKFEVYWFNNHEDMVEGLSYEDQLFECNNRYCETLTQAAAYAYDAITEAVKLSPSINLDVHDFTG
jgi:hypothetical protein